MYQQKYCRAWNQKNDTTYSTDAFIKFFFGGNGPDEQYKKVFVLNRLKLWSQNIWKVAEWSGMDEDEFRMKYMQYPQWLKDWKMPYELLFDLDGTIMERRPDLVNVPVLQDKDIYQLRPDFIKEMNL
jgi:hypothetical protein